MNDQHPAITGIIKRFALSQAEKPALIVKDRAVSYAAFYQKVSSAAAWLGSRGDDVVNIRGFKVAPTEIEDAVLHFPKVVDCACIPGEDAVYGSYLKLFVVMKEGCSFAGEEIAAFLETRLEAYKIPRQITCLAEIPKTYNGKLDRKKLKSM